MAKFVDINALGRNLFGKIGFGSVPVETVLEHIADYADRNYADVVPSEEAEKWFRECENLQGRLMEINEDIAKDIFIELSKVGINEWRYPAIAEIKKKYMKIEDEKDCLCPRCREKKNDE